MVSCQKKACRRAPTRPRTYVDKLFSGCIRRPEAFYLLIKDHKIHYNDLTIERNRNGYLL